ncbi:hypothetical protein [Actinoplanes sp. M2I2]|uniref:hypothetical protein n=1 Tax=Actinoplanes sp. M2I2 TaxID=1734444 RepID=UPI00202092AD|nr:hypothetical protein [Actinoplanes sp. M2I2]
MTELRSRLDPQRHADLRRVLVAQARPGPPARRKTLIAVTAAVVATGAAVLVVRPDPAPRDAPWTAVPQAAPPLTAPGDDIDRWASKCSDLGVAGVGVQGVPARPEAAAKREVLVDRRGGFTYCVDVSLGSGTPTDPLIALSGVKPDSGDGLNSMWTTVHDKPFAKPRDGAVLVLGGSLEPPPPGGPELQALQLYGLSGPAVTGVDLVLANGLRITASLRDGVWGVWWPSDRGSPAGCELRVRTASGVKTVDPYENRLVIG